MEIKIKTTKYKGKVFRSALEAKTAVLLDAAEISWTYEPYNLVLSTGQSYIPDFVVGKNLIIECKGKIDTNQIKFHYILAKEEKKDVLLISYDDCYFFNGTDHADGEKQGLWESDGICEGNIFQYYHCSKCGFNTFITSLGNFQCRECGHSTGDHDCVAHFDRVEGLVELYEVFKLERFKPQNVFQ